MNCPFFREVVARSCTVAPFRKLILRGGNEGRCLTSGHESCPYRPDGGMASASGRCPYLAESAVQYCDAAPVRRYVPASEPQSAGCGGEGHRYCAQYLAAVNGGAEDIPAPAGLLYSANHLWLDATPGCCRIGIDGLMARVLGLVDRISFATTGGIDRPAAFFTVGAVDLPVVFPNRVRVTEANLRLRAEPGRVVREPYGSAWLFQCAVEPGAEAGLRTAAEASGWQCAEADRLAQYVHARPAALDGLPLAADGGGMAPGLARRLDREELLRFWNEHFSPYRTFERSNSSPWQPPSFR